MIWSTVLPDGASLRIEKAFVHTTFRGRERRYSVSVELPSGRRRGVCHLGPGGEIRRWYSSKWAKDPDNRRAVEEALKEVGALLTVEQVLRT